MLKIRKFVISTLEAAYELKSSIKRKSMTIFFEMVSIAVWRVPVQITFGASKVFKAQDKQRWDSKKFKKRKMETKKFVAKVPFFVIASG